MNDTTFNFSFNMEGFDRRTLLAEAADRLDSLEGFLGDKPSGKRQTAEGSLLREIMNDTVEFGDSPAVYKITDGYFLSQNLEVPFRFTELTRSYNYYWIDLPISLSPRRNWAFNALEVIIVFNPHDTKDGSRPKAFQILPDQKFQDIFEGKGHLEVYLGENFELSAKTGTIGGQIGPAEVKVDVGASGKVRAGAGIAMEPYVFKIRKAKIQHSGKDTEKVKWRLDGAELFQEHIPRLTVVAQVPKQTKKMKIDAAMQAYRYFNFAPAGLQQKIKELPEAMIVFIRGGMPIPAEKSWDITSKL